MSNNGWIKWSGGDCPVAKGTMVDVKYRDGTERRGVPAGETIVGLYEATEPFWRNDGYCADIVAYRLHQPDYVTRLLTERDELKERADKLELFFHTDTYRSIDQTDQMLLKDQYAAMTEYLAVLDKRIARL